MLNELLSTVNRFDDTPKMMAIDKMVKSSPFNNLVGSVSFNVIMAMVYMWEARDKSAADAIALQEKAAEYVQREIGAIRSAQYMEWATSLEAQEL